jgi:predicted DNA binding CopG/RHH family protein
MRSHYDFSKMKGRRNPYLKLLKQSVTIRLDRATVQYFKDLADATGLPYQSLINLYLRDCAVHHRKLSFRWQAERRRTSAGGRRAS